MGHWLGTGKIANFNKSYRTYAEARNFVLKLNLKSRSEWKKVIETTKIPADIPRGPDGVYKNKGWVSWKHFLGYKRIPNNNKEFLSFIKARKIIRGLNLKNLKEWNIYSKTKRPENIPSNPQGFYKNSGWISYGDWLGSGNTAHSKKTFRSFIDARNYVIKLKIKSTKEWGLFSKSAKRPEDIPSNPQRVYKNKWKGWEYFLGK